MILGLSRRKFIATSSVWTAGSMLGFGNSKDRKTISIIHTTDLHGHIFPKESYSGKFSAGGFARCATQIRQWRKQNPDSLLVDIGDLYQGTALSYQNQGRLFIDLLGRFGYDAWSLGNHDLDWGHEVLAKNVEASKVPVLCANLDGLPKNIAPWKMCEIGGFKIALVGLMTPGLDWWLAPETLGDIRANTPADPLKKASAEAREAGADAVVVLGHLGHKKEDDYANPLRQTLGVNADVEVFIGGHTHVHIDSKTIGTTLFTQAGYWGINCGRVDLTFDLNSRKLIARTATTEFLDDRFELDPGVLQICDKEIKTSDEQLTKVIADLPEAVSGKGRVNDVAKLIASSIWKAMRRNKTPVDAVFHGTFGKGDLQKGQVTVADAWRIIPYDNTIVTASLTAGQLLEVIAEDRKTSSDRVLWPLELAWDGRKPLKVLDNGTEIDPEKKLRIAINSYDSQSASMALMRLREFIRLPSANRHHLDINTRDALIECLLDE